MCGKITEAAGPVRVDGPVGFKVSADPFQKGVSGGTFWHFNAVMNRDHACAAILDLADAVQMTVEGVPATSIGINHDSICRIEDSVVLGPAVGVDRGFDAEPRAVQCFGQQHAAGTMFVSTVAVAGAPGNQSNFFGGRQFFQPDVAELYSHRRTDVSLQCQQSDSATILLIVVGDVNCFEPVDEVLEVKAIGDDAILVPVFFLNGGLNGGGFLLKLFLFYFVFLISQVHFLI